MVKEHTAVFSRLMLLIDLCIVTGSFFTGYYLRDRIFDLYPLSFYLGLLPVLLFIWGGLLSYFGMYKTAVVRQKSEALMIVLQTAVIGFILFGSYLFLLRMQDVSRLVIGFTFITATILISLEKFALVYIFNILIKKGHKFQSTLIAFRNILIIGSGRRVGKFINLIRNNPDWGIRVLGLIDADPAKKGETVGGYEVIGVFDDIPEIIHNNVVDEVVFIVPRSWLNKIEDIMHFCESEGISVNIAVDLFELRFSRAKQTDLHGFPLLTFEPTSHKVWHLLIKRLFDFILSALTLILLFPVFVIIAVIVKTTSKGPIFFKQERCSLNGRKFILYKFRTMVIDAESKFKDLADYNEMNGPVFKMSNDPRLTTYGKFLRKSSMDELPQFWNVLKGDMSLVGPRPPLQREVDNYQPWHRRKLSMRPGITCLWQVGGRNKIFDFDEWMKLDLEYIDNWSLWLDFKILLKTGPVVLFAIGAK